MIKISNLFSIFALKLLQRLPRAKGFRQAVELSWLRRHSRGLHLIKTLPCILVALIAFAPSAACAKARITVNPDTDHPKGKIAVKGAGFDANESIDVRWDNKKLLFTVNSDSSGA